MKLFGITPKYALGRAGFTAGRNVFVVEPVNTKIAFYHFAGGGRKPFFSEFVICLLSEHVFSTRSQALYSGKILNI
jgi:hypothetical protein